MRRPCIGCGKLIAKGSRCRRCEAKVRNTPGRRGQRRFRRVVLARTGGRCARCKSTDQVQAHHVVKVRELVARGLDPSDPRWGVGLCRACHIRAEGPDTG